MRRLLASLVCLAVLVPASAACAVVCDPSDAAPARVADHCGESEKPSHAPSRSGDPTGSESPCTDCGLHAAEALANTAHLARLDLELRGEPTPAIAPEPFRPPRARAVATRERPPPGPAPPLPLAITHAPLLI